MGNKLPMDKNFTLPEKLILYCYNELPAAEAEKLAHELLVNDRLAEEFNQLKEAMEILDHEHVPASEHR